MLCRTFRCIFCVMYTEIKNRENTVLGYKKGWKLKLPVIWICQCSMLSHLMFVSFFSKKQPWADLHWRYVFSLPFYTEISNLKNVVFGYKKGWKDVKYIPKCHQSYFKIFLLNISSKKNIHFLMSFFMVILLIWRTMSQHEIWSWPRYERCCSKIAT